ncbi:hypothetical protein [Fontivita pretiosa]|uniref:hypothetical protein n=1 Tax=Fontivita pretiosa TaxID=2989684 RepID=UPI003D1773E4
MRLQITRPSHGTQSRRRGAAAVLAMLFLVLATTLTVAMYSLATSNVQTAHNFADVARAQAAAEAGLRWMAYRFEHMARPKTTVGTITPEVADALWPAIQQAIVDDLTSSGNQMLDPAERTVSTDATSITTAPISIESGGAKFIVTVQQDSSDPTYLLVSSTGTYRNASRSVCMQFKIDKKIKYAVVGKVPIQIGRNTIVEGPVAMATANKYPPLLMLSDFMHFDSTLADRLTQWNQFLQANHNGYDNRVSVNNSVEYAAAKQAGYDDINGDAYIDEYDFFLERFDSDGDKAVTAAEFTNPTTGKLYDENLFKAIDLINGPMFDGDPPRLGYNDGRIDNTDGYAKVRGNIVLATTADAWTANLAPQGKDINDMIQGTVAPTEPGQVPVEFGVDPDNMLDLDPANFEQAALGFKARSGSNAGAPLVIPGAKIENKVLSASDANGGTAIERTPYGSTSYQATYKRPVFRNMTFKNVQIPKGLNALFDNCKFEGVTWVEGERDITTSTGAITYDKNEGMNWAKRKVAGDTFSASKPLVGAGQTPATGETRTRGSERGNNLRFNNCTFEGPIAGNYATAYTHFANSWEFTGATMFNNKVDQTATIVSPQVNIEMGSFTDPNSAPSTLIGVVVAGNIDIRGSSNVDGSIIITGDGAGNTTLAYFGASDASTDPNSPMPEGGWGRLNIRYNPNRALPDGINLAIDLMPVIGTYSENVK